MTLTRITTVIILIMTFSVQAGNSKREQASAKIVSHTLKMGETVWLQAQGKKFLAIYTETVSAGNRGTAIILHDQDGYPDRQYLIHELRTVLPQHNWATLSLQIPVRETGAQAEEYYALFDEAKARIDAAVGFIAQGNTNSIALVGYGLGAMMGVYSVSENNAKVKAIVAISLAVPESGVRQVQVLSFLKRIQKPFLDIFAEYDLPAVVDTARKRRLSARDNTDYRQVVIAGADHQYRHSHILVVKRVYSWLSRTFGKR